jgi:hypothetical protein
MTSWFILRGATCEIFTGRADDTEQEREKQGDKDRKSSCTRAERLGYYIFSSRNALEAARSLPNREDISGLEQESQSGRGARRFH